MRPRLTSLVLSTPVADWNPHVDKTREVSLGLLHNLRQRFKLLCFSLMFLLVDVNILEFATILLHSSLSYSDKLHLICLDTVSGDITQLCILTNLVWRSSTDGFTIDINHGFLSQVQPNDLALLGVNLASDLLYTSSA